MPENCPAHFSEGHSSGCHHIPPQPCHHVSQPVSLKSPKPASWLIRAGIQPPWLHLTICRRATYSIISCPTWRVSLSHHPGGIGSFPLSPAQSRLTGWAAVSLGRAAAVVVYIHTYILIAGKTKFCHSVASLPSLRWEEAGRSRCV